MNTQSQLYKITDGDLTSYEIPMGKVIVVGIPSAFSPGCTNKHLPGFANNIDKLSDYKVVMVAIETPYTMEVWNKIHGSEKIDSVADPLGSFCETLSEVCGQWENMMGKTCNRFAYLFEDGKVSKKFSNPWFEDVYKEL